eukprot:TRINITY_DN5141_c0_g1_i1.p1 TRINITY_DN5141_c0_g1~~TRINITY_DN5141_c0_g1_i1.p1  ORF type:complete len:863 (-),score=251.43 TRINITY_DN5141_c0_g1_i1:62-2650(-)
MLRLGTTFRNLGNLSRKNGNWSKGNRYSTKKSSTASSSALFSKNAKLMKRIGMIAAGSAAIGFAAMNVVSADEEKSKRNVPPLAKEVKGVELTSELKLLIYRGMATNRLVRLLDKDMQEAMLNNMYPVEFEAGTEFIKEGDVGDFFYVVESGECEVFNRRGDMVRSCFSGDSFGEGGFMAFTKRSASVKAKSKVRVWCIDRDTFVKVVLPQSSRLRTVYESYATLPDPKGNGAMLMTHQDLLSSMNMLDVEEESKFKYLFEMADKDKSGTLDFTEFALFDLLASKPDAEFELAFRLFDFNSNGVVSKEDVLKVMEANKSKHKFDSNCNLMIRFFGPDGKRKLRLPEFSQFFLNLTEEIPRQLFVSLDKEGKGFINGKQFTELLGEFGSYRLPHGIQERLYRLKSLNEDNQVITYGEFIAFNEFLNHLPALDNLITQAVNRKGGPITKEEFKLAATHSLASNLSPLEIDVIFTIYDTNRDGKIDGKDFRCVGYFGRRCTAEELTEISKPKNTREHGLKHHHKSWIEQSQEAILNFGFGAIAGGIGATAVYPIDLVKTRMQNQRGLDPTKRLYKNSFDCFAKVYGKEGFFGLYRGIIPQLAGVAPEKAIKLVVNDFLRGLFFDEAKGKIYFPLEVLAGCGAGASQVIFTNPIEIVKIRLQIQGETMKLDPTFQPKGAVSIVKELGFGGLYKGASACLLRDIPFSGIFFPVFASTKAYFASRREDGKPSKLDLLAAGAIAGIPAASLVTPADVIKTRLQVEARKGEQTYTGLMDCAVKVYKAEGMKAFWKGAPARVFRSSPQFGVTLLAYETLQNTLSPSLPPRPPTNAPISSEDFDAFKRQRSFVLNQIQGMEDKFGKLRRDQK